MTNRLSKYLLLGVLTIFTPYVTTFILMVVTGDRIEGLKFGIISGLTLPHLIFGLAFIRRELTTKILLTILVTVAIYGVLLMTVKPGTEFMRDHNGHEFSYTNFDRYDFWDLAVTNLIFGLIAWEIFYHGNKLIAKEA